MTDDMAFNVLFFCNDNAARSIFAESIINRIGGGRFRGYSAGSRPRVGVHPYTVELLERLNYPTTGLRAKDWAEFTGANAPDFDFVFMVCDSADGEVCPVWPGRPMTAHWSILDPATVSGTEAEKRLAFSEAYRMLHNRISAFVNLPFGSLDRARLQNRLDDIGGLSDRNA